MNVLPALALAFGLLIQSPTPAATPGQTYKVDVVTPPTRPLDTKLFPLYLWITGAGVVINALIWLGIFRQTKLNWHQVRINIIAAKAATRSAHAAKKSADTTEHALRILERADVLLDKAGLNTGQQMTRDSRVVLTYKNFGRSRAKNVRFNIRLILPDISDYPGEVLPPIALGSNDSQSVSFHSFRQWITESTFNDILAGKIDLRFYADTVYEDVFDISHKTVDKGAFHARSRTFILEKCESD